jgi:hypothetical protein
MSYWSGKPDVGEALGGPAALALQLAYGVTRGQQRFIENAMYMHDLPSRRAGSCRRERRTMTGRGADVKERKVSMAAAVRRLFRRSRGSWFSGGAIVGVKPHPELLGYRRRQ